MYESEKRCDSRIEEADLQKLEIELKKKQSKRIKKEQRTAAVRTQTAINE